LGFAYCLSAIYGFALILGVQQLRSKNLEPRQAVGSIFLMIVIYTAIFSSLSFALFKLEWAHYEGEVIKMTKGSHTFVEFIRFYWWLFLDLLPVLKVQKTLHMKPPLEAKDFAAGLPIVMFRGFVALFLLKEIKIPWGGG
jgi:hypothetical protein